MMRYAQQMLFRVLPLIVGLVPIVGITAAYQLATNASMLPDCIPYLDGCTSISSTGRYMPGSLAFRASMFPQAAFLMFLWWYAAEWLRATAARRYASAVFVSGMIGGVALIVYVTFLGTKTELYEIMRRVGIYLYFLGIAVSQLLFTLSIERSGMRTTMLATVAIPWVLGIANLLQKSILAQPNNIENRIEWWVALAMQLWFVLLYFYWRRTGLAVRLESAGRGGLGP